MSVCMCVWLSWWHAQPCLTNGAVQDTLAGITTTQHIPAADGIKGILLLVVSVETSIPGTSRDD